MKKKLFVYALAIIAAFTGCSASSSKPAADISTSDQSIAASDSVSTGPDADIPVSEKKVTEGKASDFITIGDYKNIKLSLPKDTVAEEGMIADISFAGTVQGEDGPRDGMTSDSYNLELGSGTFITGFEEALIGHKAGETVNFTIPFPEDYGEETLAGKDTDWEVTIHSLLSGTASKAFSDLINEAEVISFPKDIYDDATEYINEIYKVSAESSGVTLEEFLSANNIDLDQVIRSEARSWLTSLAVMEAEGITEESSEYTQGMANILSSSGFQTMDEAVENGYPESYLIATNTKQVAYQIIQKYIQSNNESE